MLDKQASKDSMKTFCTLLITYFIISGGLLGLHYLGICNFQVELTTVENIIFSLPMFALYLLVFLAATAGYARGKYMLEKLPLSTRLKQELDTRSMAAASIRTKVRAGSQITAQHTFFDVVNSMVSSRISILAVVDDQDNIQGVITATDLLLFLQKTLKDCGENLYGLRDATVNDLHPSVPVSVSVDDKLQSVTESMIRNQFSKLIVADGGKFSGTVDALDVLAELLDQ